MYREIVALVFAASTLATAAGACAQTPPTPKAEVLAKWRNFASDGFYTHYRQPVVTRKGASATVWKMADPTPSMAAIGVPTIYSRLEFDCAARRKKFLAIVRLKADGSVKPPEADDIALDKWFEVIDAADVLLFKDLCEKR